MSAYLRYVPVMADFSNRDGGSGAPAAKERHIGWLGSISKISHECIEWHCATTLQVYAYSIPNYNAAIIILYNNTFESLMEV